MPCSRHQRHSGKCHDCMELARGDYLEIVLADRERLRLERNSLRDALQDYIAVDSYADVIKERAEAAIASLTT